MYIYTHTYCVHLYYGSHNMCLANCSCSENSMFCVRRCSQEPWPNPSWSQSFLYQLVRP